MQRKKIIALILVALIAIMVIDFRINDENVIADFFMQFETQSMQQISSMSELGINNELNTPEAIRKSSFNYNQTQNIEEFILNNPVGSVDIEGHDKDSIEVTYEIKVYARDAEVAEDYLDEINVDYEVSNEEFEIFIETDRPKPSNIKAYEVEFDIKAPKDLYINLANKYGKVKVQNFNSGLDLTTKYNATIVNFVKGNININNKYGSLNVSDLDGQIVIDSSYNQNDFKNITGNLKLETAYTQTYLDNIYADVELEGRYGGGNFENLRGDLDLDIKYMGLTMDEVKGKIAGNMEYGEVTIESLRNEIDVTSRYSDLKIWMVKDFRDLDVRVKTRHGNLRTDLNLDIMRDDNTRTITGTTGDGSHEIRIDASYADVELLYEN